MISSIDDVTERMRSIARSTDPDDAVRGLFFFPTPGFCKDSVHETNSGALRGRFGADR